MSRDSLVFPSIVFDQSWNASFGEIIENFVSKIGENFQNLAKFMMNSKIDSPLRIETKAGKTVVVFIFFSCLGVSLWFTPLPSKCHNYLSFWLESFPNLALLCPWTDVQEGPKYFLNFFEVPLKFFSKIIWSF